MNSNLEFYSNATPNTCLDDLQLHVIQNNKISLFYRKKFGLSYNIRKISYGKKHSYFYYNRQTNISLNGSTNIRIFK